MASHKHDWHEIGRVFPLSEGDYDEAWLAPDGGHHPDVDDGAVLPPTHKALKGKIPAPTFHIIVQCQAEDCPDGPKATVHWELTKAEAEKIKAAYDAGTLDPDHNGTNRMISQASLDDLGLSRLAEKLSPERRRMSGAREDLLADSGAALPQVAPTVPKAAREARRRT